MKKRPERARNTPPGQTPRPKPARHNSAGRPLLPHGLILVYEDEDLLIVDKPPGLLTIATAKERMRTAYFILTDYVRKGAARSRNRIFIVHRLDREASGLILFARREEVKFALQEHWADVEKKYLAVVHGPMSEESGVISSYLTENEAHHVHSTRRPGGKLSKTAWRVLQKDDRFSLLEIDLLTGRKHQIRVHLAEAGHPILGDDRYGRKDGQKRLALHALSLGFTHPVTRTPMNIDSRIPPHFLALMGKKPKP